MALIPKIKLCLASNCSDLTLYEQTGVYNATTNPGGYGSPNPLISQATSATLVVLTPENATYTVAITPTDNPDLAKPINIATFGNATSIEDGYWYFTYTVYDSSLAVLGTYSIGYYFYCNAECCVNKLLANVPLDSCLCTPEYKKAYNQYVEAKVFLEALKNAANCFNTTEFNKIKTILTGLCRNSNCKTCK
jgi:hypothetical protein